ncbi:hypothetical protein PO878_17685 [Iamia majanohamensis]|uniref:Uncharacterized protein n=1 Tax=Iamia majanohamensis TaxID=467976 RepID=A0AAE9Y4P0_9ACTN|nr:hypothetical protein [Iamia majanohamensis]WCO66334.1 hypothetical protein PO878_17685 [Iamia majanohamensis]
MIAMLVVGVRLAAERGAGPVALSLVALVPAFAIVGLSRRRAALILTSEFPPPLEERTAAVMVAAVVLADLLGLVLLFR